MAFLRGLDVHAPKHVQRCAYGGSFGLTRSSAEGGTPGTRKPLGETRLKLNGGRSASTCRPPCGAANGQPPHVVLRSPGGHAWADTGEAG